ncbi:hypothetical protein JZ751_001424 [Albula glossodonta]|uniref:Prion protein n=1 Tax=Albula glossodonta TaxID=121402 RepID=A0A8T2PTR8_9TELE|nr:hypothetical protein JZ751_001424 [Albula glossodonta]
MNTTGIFHQTRPTVCGLSRKGKDEATVSRHLAVPGSPPGAGSPQLGQAWRGFQIQPRVGQQKAIWFQQNQHWRVIVTPSLVTTPVSHRLPIRTLEDIHREGTQLGEGTQLQVATRLVATQLVVDTQTSILEESIQVDTQLQEAILLVATQLVVDTPTSGYPAAGGYPVGGGYPGAGGYPARYPNQYGGGAYPGGAAYPGGYAGGYPGGYPNWNPNNQILSPRYGGGYGYGGGGYGMGGSPFSRSVQNMGMGPSIQSKGFGKQAALAAGVGAVAGMAVGYGLGRFPRPHFHFHSPQEEYYYNHYMYRRYGSRSTDTNDYGRDYQFKEPPVSYDNYMDTCMKRTDLLQGQGGSQPQNGPAVPNVQGDDGNTPEAKGLQGDDPNTGESTSTLTTLAPAAADNSTSIATTNSSANTSSTEGSPVKPDPATVAPAPSDGGEKKDGGDGGGDDTVSIMEIGYPELIEQLKARRCVELYMVYSERFLEKQTAERNNNDPTGSGEHQYPLCQGLVLLLTTCFTLSSTFLLQ